MKLSIAQTAIAPTTIAQIVDESGLVIADCEIGVGYIPAQQRQIAERLVECWNACEQFEQPARDISELIEGFFEGAGEVSRDDTVHYFTVRRPGTTDTATIIISNTAIDTAQRVADCIHACEGMADPVAELAQLAACLNETPERSISALRNAVLQECADIANAIDSGRGNEKQIAAAILEKVQP